MNFLEQPAHGLHEHGEMDALQLAVAQEFVDELIGLGAVGPLPKGTKALASTPLFVLPKAGQPGQWRIIANMLTGGQNRSAGNDPVYLNRALHILEQLYTGGWSAVVDAAKFFYQFSTRPEDRPYLALKHPTTGIVYCWKSLPMGAANSPACAGRYGLAFLRKLRATLDGKTPSMRANCWWTGMQDLGYNPALGYGYLLLDSLGEPSVRLFVHVDDFLIHAQTQEACSSALTAFLDLALDMGMLCHPDKLKPPAQAQKYTGFIFDTRHRPTLRVPVEKRERALAMVRHLLHRPKQEMVSRLVLAVVAGTLESLSEATPSRLGHTYLRSMYDVIHPGGEPPREEILYTRISLRPVSGGHAMVGQDFDRRHESRGSPSTIRCFGSHFRRWIWDGNRWYNPTAIRGV